MKLRKVLEIVLFGFSFGVIITNMVAGFVVTNYLVIPAAIYVWTTAMLAVIGDTREKKNGNEAGR
ncbi:membrane protein [Gordonia phage Camerico]|nr:membrane protein [Gordonia phage Camerico]